jgi:release factor glutamine methyltransferase
LKIETYNQLGRHIRSVLTERYGAGEADAMTLLIFHALKGWDRTAMIINGDMPASERMLTRVEEILSRLEQEEPIQYILGEARFYGMDFKVNRATLIPRPETAELVDLIVQRDGNRKDLRVLDIGTGSGAIAVALSRNLPFSIVTGIDISAEALAVAHENAERLHAHIKLKEEDIFCYVPAKRSLDIIVSNPPYIAEEERDAMERNVKDYEPESALFVPDAEPLIYYNRIAEIGIRALAPQGKIYFEINPRFAAPMKEMMHNYGYCEIEIIRDSFGKNRILTAQR